MDYSNPIFSSIVIFMIILVMWMATYSWSVFVQQKKKSNLLVFLERFEGSECALDETHIEYDASLDKALLLLAKAFETSGEYHKTISIYLYIMKNAKSDDLLKQLASIYLKAGFLLRAENIYLEILKNYPRRIDILEQLGVVYESMQRYDKALETLEPLRELDVDMGKTDSFWRFELIRKNNTISDTEKLNAILEIQKECPDLYRYTISAIFSLSPKMAWKYLDTNRISEVLDLLWYLPESRLDFDKITSDRLLSKIYYARGVLNGMSDKYLNVADDIVNLDILVASKIANEHRGNMIFSYLCSKCKQSFPVSFERCPNCLVVNSVVVESSISAQQESENYM